MFNKSGQRDLSDYVKRVMRQKGLTLRDVESRSGGKITDGYVSGILRGTAKNLSVEKIKALAQGLGVDIVEVFQAACGELGQPRDYMDMDASHSLMVLELMQKVVTNPELMEVLQEAVQLSPQDRSLVLRTLRTLNEARPLSYRKRDAV